MSEPTASSSPQTYKFQFKTGELTCSSCTTTVRRIIASVKGVNPQSIKVSFTTGMAEVSAVCPAADIVTAIEKSFGATPKFLNQMATPVLSTPFDHDKKQLEQKYLWRSLLAFAFGVPLVVLEMLSLIPEPTLLLGQLILIGITLISIGVMAYCGWDIYKDAASKMRKGIVNMNTLVSLGSLLALAYSFLLIMVPSFFPMLAGMHMSLCAGVLILAIVNFGSYLKARAENNAIASLPKMREEYLRLQPLYAYKVDEHGNNLKEIHFYDIEPGDYILVEAGHYFPVDGTIVSPNTHILIDERTITGEKSARPLSTGSTIQSGTLYKAEPNSSQSLVLQASCKGEQGSFHSTMLQVSNAMFYSPENKTMNKFLGWFVPSVLLIAVTAGLLWLLLASTPAMGIAVFLAVLLCACPCALGLAAPTAYSTAVNTAFRHHIVIRHVAALDALARIKAVAFDLTGTLTEGEMTLSKYSKGINEEVLQLLASLEQASQSRHPLAGVILRANKQELLATHELKTATHGAQGIVNGKQVSIGSAAWLNAQGITIPSELRTESLQQDKDPNRVITNAYVVIDGAVQGYIQGSQCLREGALASIVKLNQQGIDTILLTGAQTEVAEAIAKQLKIKTVKAEQTPQSKQAYLESLRYEAAFLGDDPNDFPALNAKNVVGMSIHPQAPAAGAAAINLSGSVSDLDKAIYLAKLTRRNIQFSLGFMVIYNLFSIALAAGLFFVLTGTLLNPILATVLMGISSLTVVLNGMSLHYSIERKLNPSLSLRQIMLNEWRATSTLNKVIQLSLGLFSVLLLSTVIANLTLGFSWLVILNSMVLICTCCTGVVGILSAVGLIGLAATLAFILGRLAYQRYIKPFFTNSNDDQPKSPPRSLTTVSAILASSTKVDDSCCSKRSWCPQIFSSQQPSSNPLIAIATPCSASTPVNSSLH